MTRLRPNPQAELAAVQEERRKISRWTGEVVQRMKARSDALHKEAEAAADAIEALRAPDSQISAQETGRRIMDWEDAKALRAQLEEEQRS